MPIQDYCPNCNVMITVPDGVPEFSCPNCQVVLEFDLPHEDEQAPPQSHEESHAQRRMKVDKRRTSGSKKIKLGRSGTKSTTTEKPADASRRMRRRTRTGESAPKDTARRDTPHQEVLLGKVKTGPIPRTTPTPPEPVLNFVDEDQQQQKKKKSPTTQVNLPAITATPAPLPANTSDIKIAKPVGIDNVTGLLATQTLQPAPPQPKQDQGTGKASPPAVKIVGSSTEFKIEKDAKMPIPLDPFKVDTQTKTQVEMDPLYQDAQKETERARLEAEQVRRELEAAKLKAAEEKRRLDELRLQAEREQAQRQQEALQRQKEELQRQQEEMRRLAEEAKQQADAIQAAREAEEARRQQEQKEAAICRAKELAVAKAKERLIEEKKQRLIEEKKQQLIEEAKLKAKANREEKEGTAAPASPKGGTASKPKGIDLSRKKKPKRPLSVKGGRVNKKPRNE